MPATTPPSSIAAQANVREAGPTAWNPQTGQTAPEVALQQLGAGTTGTGGSISLDNRLASLAMLALGILTPGTAPQTTEQASKTGVAGDPLSAPAIPAVTTLSSALTTSVPATETLSAALVSNDPAASNLPLTSVRLPETTTTQPAGLAPLLGDGAIVLPPSIPEPMTLHLAVLVLLWLAGRSRLGRGVLFATRS